MKSGVGRKKLNTLLLPITTPLKAIVVQNAGTGSRDLKHRIFPKNEEYRILYESSARVQTTPVRK